jgi:methionyl aminopeptidase
MRESALIVSKTLGMIASEIGRSLLHLDKLAEEFIRDHGAVPSFLGLYGFPNSLCMSRMLKLCTSQTIRLLKVVMLYQ